MLIRDDPYPSVPICDLLLRRWGGAAERVHAVDGRERDRTVLTRRAVERGHDAVVLEPLLAGRVRPSVRLHTLCEVVHLERELILLLDLRRLAPLDRPV